MIYSFGGVTLPLVGQVSAPAPARIAVAETPGRAGEYAGPRRAASRTVTVGGLLKVSAGQTYDDLLTVWSTFVASLYQVTEEGPAKLYIRSGWFLNAHLETPNDTQRGPGFINYELTFKVSDPYFYSDTISAATLTTAGGTFACLGQAPALPTISITVSAIGTGGTVTIVNSTTGESFTITPDATGTYLVDSLAESVTVGGVDKMSTFSGVFPTLAADAITSTRNNTIVATTSGGATISALSLEWRVRTL